MRSACDSERPTTVTHGKSWSLDSCGHESAQLAFPLVRALETSLKLVVRGRVELPTFRFSGQPRQALCRPAKTDVTDKRNRARRKVHYSR